jgi:hypothetical protein
MGASTTLDEVVGVISDGYFRYDEALIDTTVLPGFSIPTSAIFEGV